MTPLRPHSVSGPLALGFALALTPPALVAAADPAGTPMPSAEVLNLEEAAGLLRVDPAALFSEVESGRVPGRRVAGEWRFSRAALIAWLAGGPSLEPMAAPDLVALSGRGPEGGSAPSTIGEAPETETAEQVSLREVQVLLRPGEIVLEPSLSYSFDQGRDVRVIFLDPSLPIAEDIPTQKQRGLISSLAARYGLLDDTELFAEYTYERDRNESFDTTSTDELKSFSGGLRQTLVHERPGVPSMVLLLGGRAPVANISPAFNVGFAAVSSSDPALLFGGMQFQHVYARDFDNISLLEHEDTFSANLGYAFALNDALTLSLTLSGVFGNRTSFDHPLPNTVLERQEDYYLRFAMTRMLSPGTYIEPVLTFLLNGNESKVVVGLNVPYLIGRGDR